MDVKVTLNEKGAKNLVQRVGVGRTARRIMDGYAYVPKTILE